MEDRKNGVTFTQAWSTANVLRNHIELENHIAKGLKLELVSTSSPRSRPRTLSSLPPTKQPGLHTRQHLDLFKGPTFTADAVLGRDGFLAGAEASYDVKEGKLSRYNLGAGFHAPTMPSPCTVLATSPPTRPATTTVSTLTPRRCPCHLRLEEPHSNVNLEVGTKTYLDNAAFVKAKINNAGILCLGYTQALRPGVKASFGLALDTVKLSDSQNSANAHKLGASVTFEA